MNVIIILIAIRISILYFISPAVTLRQLYHYEWEVRNFS
nr:MAG TPA: hypothetical protein [Caudoviricetes sp.]